MRIGRGVTLHDVASERPRTLTGLANILGTGVEFLLNGEKPAAAGTEFLSTRPPLSAAEVISRARKDIARTLGLQLAKVRVEID